MSHDHEKYEYRRLSNLQWCKMTDPRKIKRQERKIKLAMDPVTLAYFEGEDHAWRGKERRNPYPPGKRREAYEKGYRISDPMGDYHGRNY